MDLEIEEELIPCSNCGRTFVKSSLERHFNICIKNVMQNRRKFDSSKQRIQGTELEQYLPPPIIKPPSRPRSRSVPGQRRGPAPLQHEQCQFCGRSFSDKAIDRHREWCQSHSVLRQQPVNTNSPAYERMQARTKYRAPMAKTMRAKTREKYSPASSSSIKEVQMSSPRQLITKRASMPDTVARRVASPDIHKRVSSPDIYKRISSPDIHKKISTPEFHKKISNLDSLKKISSPDLHRRIFSPEIHQRVASPDFHKRVSSPDIHPRVASPDVHKRASLPDTRRPREKEQPVPAASHDDKYDVFLSAERQLKELGLLDCPNSPALNRRELPFASHEEVTSTPSPSVPSQPPSKSPSSTSGSNSTELLILEDEEEYLIQQLAEGNQPSSLEEKSDEVTPGTSGDFSSTSEDVTCSFDSNASDKHDEVSNNNLSLFNEQESKSFVNNSKNYVTSHFLNDSKQFETEKVVEKNINDDDDDDDNYYDKATAEAELLFNTLKHNLERPDVTLEDECPLTESLKYLDAALSLFQLEDMPSPRPSDAPRSKASTKRRLYSTASPLSLLTPEPATQSYTSPVVVHDDKCEECGSMFPLPSARFCCLCGTRRPL